MSLARTHAMSEPTPYFDDGSVRIYHGRAEDVLPVLGSTFDVGFADPPYNYGVDYGPDIDDNRPDYTEWCGEWFDLLRPLCGRVFITPGHGNLEQWLPRSPSGIACWYKPGNPAKAGIFQFCEWEPVLVWGKAMGGSDVYKATLNPTFKKDIGHPCPKPVKLVTRILTAAKATSVLDPFMGSGTTLVAAHLLGLSGVGIEQSEQFCEVAAKRLSQATLDFGEA